MILAYLDAGTGSLIIQTVLGGAAGLAVLFKSTRSRMSKRNSAEETASTEAALTDVNPLLAEQKTES